jgi:natural product precursor
MEQKKLQLKNSKLSLKKESIAKLSEPDMASLRGGEANGSTCVNFTCNWCTSGGETNHSTRSNFTCSLCTTISVSVSVWQ